MRIVTFIPLSTEGSPPKRNKINVIELFVFKSSLRVMPVFQRLPLLFQIDQHYRRNIKITSVSSVYAHVGATV